MERRSIKKLREALGLSQAKLARLAEMNSNTICAIEKGRLIPYPGQAKKIARVLGVPIDSLAEVREPVVAE